MQHSPWVHMITWKYAWMQPLQVHRHAEGYIVLYWAHALAQNGCHGLECVLGDWTIIIWYAQWFTSHGNMRSNWLCSVSVNRQWRTSWTFSRREATARMWLGGLMRREKHCRQTLQNWMHNWQQWRSTMILQLSCSRWKNYLYWQRMRWDLSHIVALQANFVVFGPSCVMVWPAAMVPHCVCMCTACVQHVCVYNWINTNNYVKVLFIFSCV